MNRIKSISVEDLVAVLEPGVITGELMKAVEAQGLFYPPDPNSLAFCTMGGNVAENAGGPRALKYGVTRDYVLGLEWVLPNGEILRVGRQTIKGVAGYDLVGLFVGSEGTLGVATEITVQLLPLPKRVRTALVLFRSVFDAAKAVSAAMVFTFPRAQERRSWRRSTGMWKRLCSRSCRPSAASAKRTARSRRWWQKMSSSGKNSGRFGASFPIRSGA